MKLYITIIVYIFFTGHPSTANENSKQIFEELVELKRKQQEGISAKKKLDSYLHVIELEINKKHALLGIPRVTPHGQWKSYIIPSIAIILTSIATGGLSSAGLACFIKGSSIIGAAKIGGFAGGIIGINGLRNSVSNNKAIHFETIVSSTIPQSISISLCLSSLQNMNLMSIISAEVRKEDLSRQRFQPYQDKPSVNNPTKYKSET